MHPERIQHRHRPNFHLMAELRPGHLLALPTSTRTHPMAPLRTGFLADLNRLRPPTIGVIALQVYRIPATSISIIHQRTVRFRYPMCRRPPNMPSKIIMPPYPEACPWATASMRLLQVAITGCPPAHTIGVASARHKDHAIAELSKS
ncbi:hypothetical protein C8R43DRAFT_1113256 [Mycena crocata]|nr:hypothetical protein C8R43DRAFT_1113256 [Mycena crocata]